MLVVMVVVVVVDGSGDFGGGGVIHIRLFDVFIFVLCLILLF